MSFVPNTKKDYLFTLIVNVSNDKDRNNDVSEAFANVVDEGADLSIYRGGHYLYFTKGQETQVDFVVVNVGTTASSESQWEASYIVLGKKNSDSTNNRISLSNGSLPAIEPGQEARFNLSFIPQGKGEIELFVELKVDNDVNVFNNANSFWFRILNDGKDLGIDYFYAYDATKGEPARMSLGINNLGSEDYDEGVASLFIDGNWIENKSFGELLSRNWIYIDNWDYVPLEKGKKTARIVLDAKEDIDLSDNSAEVEFKVREKKNVSVSATNSSGGAIHRLLMIETKDDDWFISTLPVQINLTVFDEEPMNVLVVNPINSEFNPEFFSNPFSMIYSRGIIKDNDRFVFEYYPAIIQNNIGYYFVSVNKAPFVQNRENKEIALVFNQTLLDEAGINVSEIEDYSLFYCTSFNFLSKACNNEWEIPVIVDFDSKGDFFLRHSEEINESVEAFALSRLVKFDGNSSDIDSLPDIAENVTFERSAFGKVRFLSEINALNLRYYKNNLPANIKISHKKISVNTEFLSFLENISASLEFRNIDFNNPRVLRDGALCSSEFCSGFSYDRVNKKVFLDVSGFSEYSVVEGSYCGDGNRDEGENCQNCVADYGVCQNTRGSESGGGRCRSEWSCTWSLCLSNIQKFVCTDNKKCGNKMGKPKEETRACLINQNCTDSDRDGYGIGSDCLGFDLNDNDPAVNKELPPAKVDDKTDKKNPLIAYFTFIGVMVLLIVSLIIIIFKMLNDKRKLEYSTSLDSLSYKTNR